MGRIYYPFEDVAMRPTFAPLLPGTPHSVLVGNPHLRSGEFVNLPGYGMEAAEAGTNLVVDPDFPDVTNWIAHASPVWRQVSSQYAMDQGEFLKGLYIKSNADDEGAKQAITIVDATDYTPSVWAYTIKDTLSGVLKLTVDKGDATYVSVDATKVREWERLVIPFTSTGTAGIIYLVTEGIAEGYFWMPQWETGTYAKPARVGAQPASCIYTPSPISETQTPWSALCVVTPDWGYDTAISYPQPFGLYEDADNMVHLYYDQTDDKWTLRSLVAATPAYLESVASAHSRLDKIRLVVTCDGYNAYLYVNGVQTGPLAIGSVQPANLIIGAKTTAVASPINGVVDDFAFLVGSAIPEFRVQEIDRAARRGVPLHGILDQLA